MISMEGLNSVEIDSQITKSTAYQPQFFDVLKLVCQLFLVPLSHLNNAKKSITPIDVIATYRLNLFESITEIT